MPQSIECPACRNDVAIRDPRPGRFRIACPRCGSGLILTVPDDPGGAIVAELEPAAAPAEPRRVDAVRSGWVGRYKVVGPGRGRAWGFGPEVSLGVVRDRWATDHRFVASWALEALAAGELRHPNLLESGGVEVAGNKVFAAGVAGRSTPLADPAARTDLDRQARVAAVLHAARGLRFAHEQGVYHRDLDLDAIRIDPAGRIMVAGAGLGLTPTSEAAPVAPIPLAAPGDATPVAAPPVPDAVTDVVGIGRVLATLVAGAIGDRAVPPGLATLVRRLVGEGAAGPIDDRERFRDLGAVVRALEAELGVAGPLNPPEAEAGAFEGAIAEFRAAPLIPLRRWVGPGFATVLGLIALAMLASGRAVPAVGWVAFGALIAAALAAFRAWDARDRLADRAGAALAVAGRRDAVTLGVVGLLGVGTLLLTHFLATALIVTLMATALAAAYHFGLDRPLAASRSEALERLESQVKAWRRHGHDEAAIRRYVATVGGREWEEVFGAIFGLDAIGPARGRWGSDLAGGRRPRFAPIRGWLLGRWDRWIAGRVDERTRTLLEPILERDQEARGMHVLTARRKAKRSSAAVVAVLGQFRRAPDESVGLPLAGALRKAVERPEDFLASPEIAEAAESPAWWATLAATVEAAFGPRVRFLLGAASLAAAFVWMEQNALVSYEQGKQALLTAAVEGDRAHALDQARRIGEKFVAGVAKVVDAPDPTEPMDLGVLPPAIATHLNGFALTATGLILLASSLVAGPRIIPFAVAGALIPLAPRLVVPSARPLDFASLVAMGVGLAVFAVGMMWGRRGS